MKGLKLQTVFFLTYLSLSSIVLLVFGSFFYIYASNRLTEESTKSISELVSSFEAQTEQVIETLDNVSININYSSLIKNKLDTSFDLNLEGDDFRSLADLFVMINGADSKAEQINLYNFNGNVLRVGTNTRTDLVSSDTLPYLDEVRELGGSKFLTVPYLEKQNPTHTTYHWYISLLRTYQNKHGKQEGVIETTQKCKTIFRGIETYIKKNETVPNICVFDQSGNLIFPYNISDVERQTLTKSYSHLNGITLNTTFFNEETDYDEIASSFYSGYTKWTYVVSQQESIVLSPVKAMVKTLSILLIIISIICIFISYFMSRQIVRPIKSLKHIIQRIELNTLGSERANTKTSINELNELNFAFQSMSDNLKGAMDDVILARKQELKSRTLALQSQINPHFYYNTLSTIMVLAENEQSTEVATMCRNLSQMMRYITNGNSETVTLSEELSYVEKYMYCMKVRYQESLTYNIMIDEDLLDIKIPKLILQPLVENAIKYGTETFPPWHINISSFSTSTKWGIMIKDTGNGFSEEAMEKINKRICEADHLQQIPDIEINGMGLLNVYLRWKLFVGDQIIFNVENTVDGHGLITIGKNKLERESTDE